MSKDFQIDPVTSEQVQSVRRQWRCGLHEAKDMARRDNIEAAIHRAKDVEDCKVCLLAVLLG